MLKMSSTWNFILTVYYAYHNIFMVLSQAEEQTEFVFTPDNLQSDFGSVTLLRSDAVVEDNQWQMEGDYTQTPIEMALRATILADTNCNVNNFEIEYDAGCTTSECDGAFVISAGSEYISLMFDFDGAVFVNEGLTAGTAIYPPCDSILLPQIPNDSTDASDLFDDSNDLNNVIPNALYPSFYNWRDRMAGGNRDNWNLLNNQKVGSQDGFTIGFNINEDTNTMTIRFEAGTYVAECSMNTIFSYDNGKDVNVNFSPDYDSNEEWYINSMTVRTDCTAGSFAPTSAPSNSPTMRPTNDPTNDPTSQPTSDPTRDPTNKPTNNPTNEPTAEPTLQPTMEPTNPVCVEPCDNDPCLCNEPLSNDFDENCDICHPNGCDRCFEENGYFKADYDSPCQQCQESFGEGCLHCQDFNGCAQCDEDAGYRRVECPAIGFDCDLYCCEYIGVPSASPTSPTAQPIENTGDDDDDDDDEEFVCPSQCDGTSSNNNICPCDENEFCSDCQSWGCASCQNGYFHKNFGYPCVSCQSVYGNSCSQCNSWQGCTSCVSGYTYQWDQQCGLSYCQPN